MALRQPERVLVARRRVANRTNLIWLLAACALIIRLVLVIWAGNAPQTPLTGGSDTLAYQALGDSLTEHRGLSYAGMPTALRPPLYPLFLAAGQVVAGKDYRLLVRLIQLGVGVLMAFVCARTSEAVGGAKSIASAAALAAPTLVFFSAEILSETLAALIVSIFFFLVVTDRKASPVLTGVTIGLGMIERFNLAALAPVYVAYQIVAKKPSQAARNVALAGFAALAVVSPWFVRNLATFHGQVLYSTHTGTNLLQGLITPDGRTQAGDGDKLEAAAGWTIADIETNEPSRAAYPPEPQLDREAMKAALSQLPHVNVASLILRKLGYFWLSFDQLYRTQSLGRQMRLVRYGGVVAYWLLLGLGVAGLMKFRVRNRDTAILFVAYAIIVTCMHLPFVMNTRIRAPLMEPALAILAGVALAPVARNDSLADP